MIPADLQRALADAGQAHVLPSPTLLAHLEALADAAPASAPHRAAVAALHGWLTRDAGLPPTLGGVVRERVVRWDEASTTWTGPRADGSGHGMVRALRPHAARDPVHRRQLARDRAALADALPGLELHDGPAIALSAPLPGPTFAVGPGVGRASPEALARLLAGTTAGLLARERAGVGFAHPADEELVDAGDHLAWVCLTPFASPDPAPVLEAIARGLQAWWDPGEADALTDVLAALRVAAPRTIDDAAGEVRATLATVLAGRRHALVARARRARSRARHDRLHDAALALHAAAPPPAGRGAVGVDLDGLTLVVVSDGAGVHWGPHGARPVPIVFDDGELDPGEARRLLRARAGAPLSDRLNHEVAGSAPFVEALCRWVSAALELRTLRRLLAIPDGDAGPP